MRFATIKVNGTEKAGIVLKNGVLPIEALNAAKGTAWAEDVMSLIQKQQIPGLTKWYNAGGKEELESIPGLVPSEKLYMDRSTAIRNVSLVSVLTMQTTPETSVPQLRRDFREASSNRQTP